MSDSEQEKAVRALITSYVDACHRGDVMALRALFHDSASLSGYLADNVVSGAPDPFFDAVAGNPAPDEAGLRYDAVIESVVVNRRIATAVLSERGYLGMDFINHFQLLYTGGQWYITAKLFESAEQGGVS